MSARTLVRITAAFRAALTGGEDDVRRALELLDESELSRLRNTMRVVGDLAEQQRKRVRRESRG